MEEEDLHPSQNVANYLHKFRAERSFKDSSLQQEMVDFLIDQNDKYNLAIISFYEKYKKKIADTKKKQDKLNDSLMKYRVKYGNLAQKRKKQTPQDQKTTHIRSVEVLKDFCPPQSQFYKSISRNFIVMNYKSLFSILDEKSIQEYDQSNSELEFLDSNQFKEEIIVNEKKYRFINSTVKSDLIHEHELHRLKFFSLQVINKFGPCLSNMHVLSLIFGKDPQQIGIKVWFPSIQHNFGKEIEYDYIRNEEYIYKIKPYKYISFFCIICMKFNCLVHFQKDEWHTNLHNHQHYNMGYYKQDTCINSEVSNEIFNKGRYVNRKLFSRKNEQDQQQQHIQWGQLYKCKDHQQCPQQNYELKYKIEDQAQTTNNPQKMLKQHRFKKFQIKYVEFSQNNNLGSTCFTAFAFDGTLNCKQVFQIQTLLRRKKQLEQNKIKNNELMDIEEELKKRKIKRKDSHNYESRDKLQKKYSPCFHEGPCTVENECICAISRGKCEKYCMCSSSCGNRYQGCNCKGACKTSGIGDKNQLCPCYLAGRECDPDLCLCPSHNNKRTILNKNLNIPYCRNTDILYKVKPRLILQKSMVCDGLGVMAGQTFQKGDFVGEYVGEILSKDESLYRDHVYLKKDVHYFFDLGYDNEIIIDPYPYGSKVRFLNYVNGEELENCEVKYIFVDGTTRIALLAKKTIHPGQELFFNYGEVYCVGWKKQFDLDCDLWNQKIEQKKNQNKLEKQKQLELKMSTLQVERQKMPQISQQRVRSSTNTSDNRSSQSNNKNNKQQSYREVQNQVKQINKQKKNSKNKKLKKISQLQKQKQLDTQNIYPYNIDDQIDNMSSDDLEI